MNEDKTWVAAVIASCTILSHLTYIPTLIELFEKKHPDFMEAVELEHLYETKKHELTHKV